MLFEDFLDDVEHDQLMECIQKQEWNHSLSRRVQHYGFEYPYFRKVLQASDLLPAPSIPASFKTIIHPKLVKHKIIDEKYVFPNQVIVNEYKSGQGISAHTDNKVFKDTIVSITLGAACTMEFKKQKMPTEEKSLVLSKNSALVLQNEFRYDWTHEIEKKKNNIDGTRISITLRYV